MTVRVTQIPDERVVVVGTIAWGVAFVVLVPVVASGHGHAWWLGTCAAGFALGLAGRAYTRRRAAAIARDEAAGD